MAAHGSCINPTLIIRFLIIFFRQDGFSMNFTDIQVRAAKIGRTQVKGTTGLYIHVNPDGSRRWIYRFTKPSGKPTEMGLGRYPVVTLQDARDKVFELARQAAKGEDPVASKRAARLKAKINDTSFADCVADYAKAFASKGAVIEEMVALLKLRAAPLMCQPIAAVDTDAIARALAPINGQNPRTARRALRAVSKILRFAKVKGLRATGDDADWKDAFEHIWAPAKPGSHQEALPYADVPAFFAVLGEHPRATSLALQMLILCASRTGEILGAQWQEIDLSARTWTIPANRMKKRKEHVVPLSDAALLVLERAVAHFGTQGYIFKGQSKSILSPRSLEGALHVNFKVKNASVHGFRSAFRDWAGDMTETPREVCEAALAHSVPGVEGAYGRGSALQKRRVLMQAWGQFVTGITAASNVLPLVLKYSSGKA
jgi:integrase